MDHSNSVPPSGSEDASREKQTAPVIDLNKYRTTSDI